MIRLALFALAVFFSLSACRPTTPAADAGAPADGGAAAPVVVNPAAPAPAAPGSDGGAAVVMPEATVKLTPAPAAPAAPVDLKADAKAKAEAEAKAAAEAKAKNDTMPVPPHAP